METIRVTATRNALEYVTGFVLGCAQKSGLAESSFLHLELVVEELLVNVASYAYGDTGGELEISCWEEDKHYFTLSFTDWGDAFNPLEMPDPDLTANIDDRRIGGLGIHLVKKMANHISYIRKNERNILTISFDIEGKKDA